MKQLHKIKYRAKNIRSNPTFTRALIFIVVFGIAGGALLIFTRAATPTLTYESEQQTLTSCASVVDDATASNSKAISFGCPVVPPPPPVGFVHPGVVYTKSQIDSWSTSSSEYTRLKSTSAACLDGPATTTNECNSKWTPINYGTRIDSGGNATCTGCELNDGLKDQSGAAKIQAVLWAADGNVSRRNKVVAYLDGFKQVTSYEWDSTEQYRLVSGWGCTNLAQAAEIVGYHDTGFETFLRKCYDITDWPTNPNWHASFADSKLAIAAYLGDSSLWANAKSYFYERIAQSIYLSKYDKGYVIPMHNEDNVLNGGTSSSLVPKLLHAPPGTQNTSRTVSHWGYGGNAPQITTSLKAEYPAGTPLPDGTNAERTRDLGHVSMSLGAWMHGLRTIYSQGQADMNTDSDYKKAYDRLLAAYDYHSGRIYTYLTTGAIPAPVPIKGEGGPEFKQTYYGARTLFGTATPQSVKNMLLRSEVTGYSPSGANHLVAEAFADQ